MIDTYSFGRIKIQEHIYTKDLIIFPDQIKCPWWRKSGHKVLMEDLAEVFAYELETLIIGTGYYGLVKVDNDVLIQAKQIQISLITANTRKAVEIFNKNYHTKKTIGAFHLTC